MSVSLQRARHLADTNQSGRCFYCEFPLLGHLKFAKERLYERPQICQWSLAGHG